MPLHSHSPSQSLTHRPTITPLSVTLSTLTQTSCHPLYSLTHPFHSHSFSTILHSSASPKDLIKPQRGVQRLYQTLITELWVPSIYAVSGKKKKKRWVPLCKMQRLDFHCLVAEKQWEKSKKLWFQFFFFFSILVSVLNF